MALVASLRPESSKKARATAVGKFCAFLATEDVSMENLHAHISSDPSGSRLVAAMDGFGVYLAFYRKKNGDQLSVNAVISYFRQVKGYLLDMYPGLKLSVNDRLVAMAKMLDKFCIRRGGGNFVNKAPSCTKADLCMLVRCIYMNAQSSTDYQDAALLCLMWHCLGRSSDLGFVQKQHVTVSVSGVVLLRILRVKVTQEQELTLIQDRNNFLTCPLFTMAGALAMQDAACPALLSQVPALVSPAVVAIEPTVPLRDLLELEPFPAVSMLADSKSGEKKTGSQVSINAHINRLLRRLPLPAEVTKGLTSHSFRRGSAQHANGDERLAAQWIFDRGAWNMSKTNQAFAYVMNTPREDRKVARVLSGWDPSSSPPAVSTASLVHTTREKLVRMEAILFGTCSDHSDARLNISTKVRGVLMAYLLMHLQQLRDLNPHAPIVRRVDECARAAWVTMEELEVWSSLLTALDHGAVQATKKSDDDSEASRQNAALFTELITLNRANAERIRALEQTLLSGSVSASSTNPTTTNNQPSEPAQQSKTKHKMKARATKLSSIWYEWYGRQPRGWASTALSERRRRSDYRLIVAYMKLFLPDGFILNDSAADYKDHVLRVGRAAEVAVLSFLNDQGQRVKSGGSVLRAMRQLQRSGALNDRIHELLGTNSIRDPAPISTHNIIALSM